MRGKEIMKIKALLFDLDGLLFDSERIYYDKWKQAGLEAGYEIPEETLLSLRACDPALARERIENSLGVSGIYDGIRARRRELVAEYISRNRIAVKPGVHAFLGKTAGLPDVKKAVVTMSHKGEKEEVLREAGLFSYFDEIITPEDVKRGKPYPDIYLHACSRLCLKPCECITFEDAPNGIESALAAGTSVIMIPDMTGPDEGLRERCLAVYPTITDAWELVREMC